MSRKSLISATELWQIIASSDCLGVGSCSTLDETEKDTELIDDLKELLRITSARKVVTELIEQEQVFWERENIFDWKKRNRAGIKELYYQVATLEREKRYV